MPFKSEAQRKKFHAMAARGEISPKTVHKWEHATPKATKKRLPEHVHHKKHGSVAEAYREGVIHAMKKAELDSSVTPGHLETPPPASKPLDEAKRKVQEAKNPKSSGCCA
jgi:hypothetical protein